MEQSQGRAWLSFGVPAQEEPTGHRQPSQLTSPITRRVFEYWDHVRGDRAMPSRQDIDPAALVRELPYLILLDVARDPWDFRYRLIGTHIVDYTVDYTGRWMSSVSYQKPPSRVWDACQTVAETGKPIFGDVPNVGRARRILRLENIITPLSADGRSVNMLLVCAVFL